MDAFLFAVLEKVEIHHKERARSDLIFSKSYLKCAGPGYDVAWCSDIGPVCNM